MARTVVWAQRARSDLRLAVTYILNDSPEAASSFAFAVTEAARSLSSLSERGRVVPELGESGGRELLLGRYRLIYEVLGDRVAIVRLIHASRDFERAWRNEGG